MVIEMIKISNYKGFNNIQEIKLTTGLNVIAGKNNVGKTAILEALTFEIVENPHLNLSKKPRPSSKIKLDFLLLSRFVFNPDEFESYILDVKEGRFYVNGLIDDFMYVWKKEGRQFMDPFGYLKYDISINEGDYTVDSMTQVDLEEIKKWVNKVKQFFTEEFKVYYLHTPRTDKFKLEGLYKVPVDERTATNYLFNYIDNRVELKIGPEYPENKEPDFIVEMTKYFIEKSIYKFDIYRKVNPKSPITSDDFLNPDCSNLPSVLVVFQKNKPKFEKYTNLIKEVFPEIHGIIIDIQGSAEAEIKIWNRPPIEDRMDLAISLSDCGTGVSQILALLYIVVGSTTPKVLNIDEPNSYLHPSASRKLISILRRYPQHQYIISTHSPEIIASNPDNLILLTLENGETKVKTLETKQKQDIQYAMQEIGLKLSDVYGFDSILWVEGPTEQVCFPKIISRFYPKLEGNMAIVGVRHTGDFEKKYIDTTYSLYERISGSGSESFLIPPAVAFVFDREGKSEKAIADWIRGGKKIHFTEVRLYENYILDENAISSVLNDYSTEYEWEQTYYPEKIKEWLETKKTDSKYWENKQPNEKQLKNWKEEIHAAELLKTLFEELTPTKEEYRKTTHSVKLTEYLLENKPEVFDSLKQLLDKFLPK